MMNLNDYQLASRAFSTGGGLTFEYALLGLAEEAGESCGKAALRKLDGRKERGTIIGEGDNR